MKRALLIVLALTLALGALAAPPTAALAQPQTAVGGVFLAMHFEVGTWPHMEQTWPRVVELVALADRYGFKLTLQFSPQWAQYVYETDQLATVHGWEQNGHEIALHHHGPSHKYFDGYTNDPSLLQPLEWYGDPQGYRAQYLGDIAALMDFMAPLSQRGIVTVSMTDEEADWPDGALYNTDGQPHRIDGLLSVPEHVTYRGQDVLQVYNVGYAIARLGEDAVTLAGVEDGLQRATPDQIMGLVINDDTLQDQPEALEALFELLTRYGVGIRTVRDLLGAEAPSAQAQPAPPTPTPTNFPPVEGAEYGQIGDVRYVRVPYGPCTNVTATPTVVGDWLLYPMHEYGRGCEPASPYGKTLLGYNTRDGQLYAIYRGASAEAPLLYQAESGLLFWPVTFGKTVIALDAASLQPRWQLGLGPVSDSAGTWLEGVYYFGTVNTPFPPCQQPLNPNCGALFGVNAAGAVVYSRTTDDGFRAWIGSGLTTDGQVLYVGSAAQTVGEKSGDEETYLYGCSVVKLDAALNVLASFDPGDLACYKLPFEGANEDSVAGEVVIGADGLWAQYVRPNQGGQGRQFVSALYHLSFDLQELCRVEFPFEPRTQAVGFYAAPTVDAQGRAYVTVNVPDAQNERRGQLWRVEQDCTATLLAERVGAWAYSSPTLADDRYVLFGSDGWLGIYTYDGELVREYALGSSARVMGSPTLVDGVIYVLQEDGTLNIITGSGLQGYGNALWPRYRHDNAASGRAG